MYLVTKKEEQFGFLLDSLNRRVIVSELKFDTLLQWVFNDLPWLEFSTFFGFLFLFLGLV